VFGILCSPLIVAFDKTGFKFAEVIKGLLAVLN
jgi:hypothetical protein